MNTHRTGALFSNAEIALLISLGLYSLVPVIGGLLRVFELAMGGIGLPENPRAAAAPLPIIAHVLTSAVFCIGGALQLLPGVRRCAPDFHRLLGRAVLVAGVVSATTGLRMTQHYTFPADLQGSVLYATRMLVGLSMLAFLGVAVMAAWRQQFPQHGAFMLRAYALGQGASTQTFLGLAWMLMFEAELLCPARDGMMVLGWVFNALFAEYLVRKYLLQPSTSLESTRVPSMSNMCASIVRNTSQHSLLVEDPDNRNSL